MRSGLLIVAFGAACLLTKAAAFAGVDQATPTATGVWQQVGDDGKVGALVTISEEEGVYVGRLSQLFPEPGDDPNPICTECPGDKHNQPILGLVFIEGMKQSGLDYEDGTILDPESGKTYHASMHLSPDGTKLTVRGYIGLEIFGRSQTWNRVQ
ncbi:MAG: DUF2147 domain-containing protein [Actinomycetota bacterium]